jgi:osmotically-inducible protein OsmY
MKNNVLKFLLPVSIIYTSNCLCLAGSTESSTEAPFAPAVTSVDGAGGNTAPQINLAIQQSHDLSPEAKHVTVTYENGTVFIRGTVPTTGDRQKISSIAEQAGAPSIRNELKVEHLARKKKSASKIRVITR